VHTTIHVAEQGQYSKGGKRAPDGIILRIKGLLPNVLKGMSKSLRDNGKYRNRVKQRKGNGKKKKLSKYGKEVLVPRRR